jgi:hypothetical protein
MAESISQKTVKNHLASIYEKLDARDRGKFRLPAGHELLGVVRLDPALEKSRRDRELHGIALDALDFHAREPAGKNVVSDFGAKAFLHTRPPILIRARHFSMLCL